VTGKFFLILLGAYLFMLPVIWAQDKVLSGMSTRWNDSFVEWEMFCFTQDTAALEEEERCGSLQLRWLNLRDDWSEWDYELDGARGNIRQKWKDDPTEWELRTFTGEVVTMRASWRNDLSQWRITNNSLSLNFRTRWSNQLNEWRTEDHTHGDFSIHTRFRNDPRDWIIEDDLREEIPQTMKIALLFLAIFHGSPKQ